MINGIDNFLVNLVVVAVDESLLDIFSIRLREFHDVDDHYACVEEHL